MPQRHLRFSLRACEFDVMLSIMVWRFMVIFCMDTSAACLIFDDICIIYTPEIELGR